MIMGHVEAGDVPEEIVTEDGEILRLEKRDGKFVATRGNRRELDRLGNRSATPWTTKQLECFRCGRTGHTRPNCTWKTHKHGGPPKPLPPHKRAAAGNLEDSQMSSGEPPAKIISCLEVNALDAEVEDWKFLFLKQATADADQFIQNQTSEEVEDEWSQYLREEEALAQSVEQMAYDPWFEAENDPWSQTSAPATPAKPPQCQSTSPYACVFRPFDPSLLPPIHLRTPLFGSAPPEEDEVMEWTPPPVHRVDSLDKTHADTQTVPVATCDEGTQTDDDHEFYECEDLAPEAVKLPMDLNMFDLDLVACDKPGYVEVKVTMDSGAAEPVCAPETFPGVTVNPSVGSQAGQIYLGPGKERIPNEGEIKPEVLLEDNAAGSMTFQAAQVRKPLMAVSSVNDKGHLVLFDLLGSFLVPASAPEVPQIRALIQQVQGKLRLHRENGVFHMKTWRKAFSRPEK